MTIDEESYKEISRYLQVMCDIFLPFRFLSPKESTFQTRENVFYFTSRAFFVIYIQIWKFWKLKFHDIIKCLSMKQETSLTE